MKEYIKSLKTYIDQHPPNLGDADSVLGMLYECHNENSPYDNEQIREDFNELYQQMNGMPLREMDRIIYPVCKLCRDHESLCYESDIQLIIADKSRPAYIGRSHTNDSIHSEGRRWTAFLELHGYLAFCRTVCESRVRESKRRGLWKRRYDSR